MSPTAFKDTLTSFLHSLSKTHDLCLLIRQNRHLPHKTLALDALQSALANGVSDLQADYNTLRRTIGSRMDLGDETSRTALVRANRELEGIKQRLGDVAMRRDEGTEGPGFRELARIWRGIETDVSSTIESLGRRLTTSRPPSPSSTSTPKPTTKPRINTDEVVLSVKEFHKLTDHMRNSWVEKFIAGRVCYVNVLDEKRIVYERPEGFVSYLPEVKGRTKSWERTSANEWPRRRDSLSGW